MIWDQEPVAEALLVALTLWLMVVPVVAGSVAAGVLKGRGWRIVVAAMAVFLGLSILAVALL